MIQIKKQSLIFMISLIFIALSAASPASLLTDQAANVRINGTLVQSANLTVNIYNESSGGSPIYTELFQDAVSGGSWDITLGETTPLTLEYGKTYYIDQLINTVNLDYKNNTGGAVDRKAFISTMGLISSEDISPTTTLSIAGLNIAGNLNITGSIISPVIASMPNLSLSQIADNIGNFSAWSNSTFITASNFTNWVNASGLIINWSGIGDNLAWQTLGNWSSDKLSYYTISQVSTIGNWSADKPSYYTISQIATLGNWSADKSGYSTTAQADALYAPINYGDDWNKTYADTLYADITEPIALTLGNWSADSSGKLLWTNSSGNATFVGGNVGIGTYSPTRPLHITRDGGVTILLENTDAPSGSQVASIFSGGSSGNLAFGRFNDGGVSASRTDVTIEATTGNVGIGTTAPDAMLDVYGNVSLNNTLFVNDGKVGIATTNLTYRLHIGESINGSTAMALNTNDIYFFRAGAPSYINQMGVGGSLRFRTSNNNSTDTTAMAITADGNVGIGTISPFSLLNIKGENARLRISSNTSNAGDVGIDFQHAISDVQKTAIIARAAGIYGRSDLHFVLNGDTDSDNYVIENDTRMIIKNTGNVGIGTTDPGTKLEIVGSHTPGTGLLHINSSDHAIIGLNADTDKNAGLFLKENGTAKWKIENDGDDADKLLIQDEGDIRLAIQQGGNVGIGTVDPSTNLHIEDTLAGLKVESTGDGGNIVLSRQEGYQGNIWLQTNNSGRWKIGITDTSESGSNVGSDLRIERRDDDGTTLGNVMFFQRSTGNVGIGTTSPEGRLHVAESSLSNVPLFERAGASSDDYWLSANFLATKVSDMGDGFGPLIGFAVRDDTSSVVRIADLGAVRSGADNSGTLVFRTMSSGSASEKMRITSDGKVGIGTSSPAANLDVNGNIYSNGIIWAKGEDGRFALENPSGDTSIYFRNNGASGQRNLELMYGANTKMVIDNSGNVGIGTSDPDSLLHAFAGSAGSVTAPANSVITLESAADTELSFLSPDANAAEINFGDASDNDAGKISYNHGSASMSFVAEGSTAMSISGNGNIGIGTTDPHTTLDIGDKTSPEQLRLSGPNSNIASSELIFVDGSGVEPYLNGISIRYNSDDNYLAFDRHHDGSGSVNETVMVVDRDSGNIGIGTSNPNSQFHVYTTDVNGARMNLESSAADRQARIRYGAADSGNYWYSGINTDRTFRTVYATGLASSNGLVIDTDGSVGIGTTSPKGNLHIQESAASDASLWLVSGNTVIAGADELLGIINFDAADGLSSVDSSANIRAYSAESTGNNDKGAYLTFETKNIDTDSSQASTEKMRITSEGKVGIGTTTPDATLHISDGTSATTAVYRGLQITHSTYPRITLENPSEASGERIWDILVDDGILRYRVLNDAATATEIDDVFVLDSGTGNMGIGTTDPSSKLHVSGGNIEVDDYYGFGKDIGSSSTEYIIKPYTQGIQDMTGGSGAPYNESMTIESDAQITFIETDSNKVSGWMNVNTDDFYWNGPIILGGSESALQTTGNVPVIFGASSGFPDGFGSLVLQSRPESGAPRPIIFAVEGEEKMRVDDTGNIGIGISNPGHLLDLGGGTYADSGGSWHDASDLRFKKDVMNISYGLSDVMKLRPVSYVNKEGYNRTQLGFIAQEVELVIPEVTEKTNGNYSLAYGRFVPLLVKALQELSDKVDRLNVQNDALKARIEALENR